MNDWLFSNFAVNWRNPLPFLSIWQCPQKMRKKLYLWASDLTALKNNMSQVVLHIGIIFTIFTIRNGPRHKPCKPRNLEIGEAMEATRPLVKHCLLCKNENKGKIFFQKISNFCAKNSVLKKTCFLIYLNFCAKIVRCSWIFHPKRIKYLNFRAINLDFGPKLNKKAS